MSEMIERVATPSGSAMVSLTRCQIALVDVSDLELVSSYRWSAHLNRNKWYALARKQTGKVVQRVQMHRLLLSAGPFDIVDHINGNTLDNRRSNLRLSNPQSNAANMHVSWGSSNYKGVWFNARLQKWSASIRKDGKHIYLGLFEDEDDAAIAYDRSAISVFGEHARTNAPRKLYTQIDAALAPPSPDGDRG